MQALNYVLRYKTSDITSVDFAMRSTTGQGVLDFRQQIQHPGTLTYTWNDFWELRHAKYYRCLSGIWPLNACEGNAFVGKRESRGGIGNRLRRQESKIPLIKFDSAMPEHKHVSFHCNALVWAQDFRRKEEQEHRCMAINDVWAPTFTVCEADCWRRCKIRIVLFCCDYLFYWMWLMPISPRPW